MLLLGIHVERLEATEVEPEMAGMSFCPAAQLNGARAAGQGKRERLRDLISQSNGDNASRSVTPLL
jgi:hypothetical protein